MHTNTTLHLYKQNFKFSAAHFLIFDEHRAEKLHGHNYQVRVEIPVPSPKDLEKTGYYLDFNVFKKAIRERLDEWDEMVLLPALHPEMKTQSKGPSLEVHFRDRFYVFPVNEVQLLPVNNTSVEQLSQLIGRDLLRQFTKSGVKSLSVSVEETAGQAAVTTMSIP